jgi:hypothetical protein
MPGRFPDLFTNGTILSMTGTDAAKLVRIGSGSRCWLRIFVDMHTGFAAEFMHIVTAGGCDG